MTTRRRAMMLGLMLAAACNNDAQPCTASCPTVEGVWFLQYVAPEIPCDGGSPATPPTTVSFTREGSVVRGAIEGIEVSGTAYDTFNISLNGQMIGGGQVITLTARYIAGSGDGGTDRLSEGRLSRNTASCRDSRRFTGARF